MTTETTGAGLAKTYNPAEAEPRVRARWDASDAFHADPSRVLSGDPPAKPYGILIPPPNVTAALHLGHALNNTLQDVLVRAHRMMGYETLWMPGTDHAGIATQAVVERRLRKEGKLKGALKSEMKREDFVAQVQAFKDEYEAIIIDQLKAMGCSCDWSRVRFTMDEQCAAAVYEAFFRLFKDGLIYRGKRLVNWDPVLQTAVADDECYDEEVDSSFWYLRYPVVDGTNKSHGTHESHGPVTWGELAKRGYPGADSQTAEQQAWVTVATTRPETYLGDTAVAVNPRDPRAAALRGLKAQLPLVGRVIPIVEDDYVVLPGVRSEMVGESVRRALAALAIGRDADSTDPKAAYATGFLKVTPAHDQNDWEIGQRHTPPLPAINVMAPDATISDKHGWTDVGEAGLFIGKKREAARKMVVEEFERLGLLEAVKPYRHSLKHSDRSKAIVEPYLSDQWYVRVTDERMAGAANRALVTEQQSPGGNAGGPPTPPTTTDAQLEFHPARYSKTYEQWHTNIRDWCISRQLWWGHRIPVWSRAGVAAPSLPDVPAGQVHVTHTSDETYVCVRQPDAGIAERLSEQGFTRDPDVLDTWFSSALWPMSTLGWPDPTKFNAALNKGMLEAYNPSDVLCTAREIITLWVSRMVMFNRYFMPDGWSATAAAQAKANPPPSPLPLGGGAGAGPVPFRDVFIHAMIQDGQGRKMSKSLNNGVDPRDIIESHGTDAMRYTLVQMTTNTQDVRMPVRLDSRTGKNTSEKFDNGRNLCNKLWNTARFVMEKLGKGGPGASSGAGVSNTANGTPSLRSGLSKSDLSLTDRWMLSRIAATVKAVNASLANYEFSDYAEALYKLLWWDLCDWYLEAVKPTVETNPVQQAVLAHALETIVRLLHPIAPFITETIWEHLRGIETAPIAGVELGPSRKGGLLCTAGWPRVDGAWEDAAAEREFEEIRELVSAIRNARSERQVSPKRRVVLHATGAAMARMQAAPGVVETLGGLERVEVLVGANGTSPPPNPLPLGGGAKAPLRVGGEELYLSNLADAAVMDTGADAEKFTKQLADLRKAETTIAGRLGNPGYIERAPAKLVEESKAQLAKLREEIAAIEGKLKGVG